MKHLVFRVIRFRFLKALWFHYVDLMNFYRISFLLTHNCPVVHSTDMSITLIHIGMRMHKAYTKIGPKMKLYCWIIVWHDSAARLYFKHLLSNYSKNKGSKSHLCPYTKLVSNKNLLLWISGQKKMPSLGLVLFWGLLPSRGIPFHSKDFTIFAISNSFFTKIIHQNQVLSKSATRYLPH